MLLLFEIERPLDKVATNALTMILPSLQLFLKSNVNLSALTDILIAQNQVGSVIKVSQVINFSETGITFLKANFGTVPIDSIQPVHQQKAQLQNKIETLYHCPILVRLCKVLTYNPQEKLLEQYELLMKPCIFNVDQNVHNFCY